MTKPTYDQDFWEGLWSKTLREHADKVASKGPNAHLTTEVQGLRPGRALDAGCGHGVESLWLAAHGWQVTAVDFSTAALEHAQFTAEAAGRIVAERIDWIHADLTRWEPQPNHYDLVVCLYLHIPGSVQAMVRRLASGVAVGGSLLLVGHQPKHPATGADTEAAGQVQVSVENAVASLPAGRWSQVVAEDRPRAALSGVDAVIRAERIR